MIEKETLERHLQELQFYSFFTFFPTASDSFTPFKSAHSLKCLEIHKCHLNVTVKKKLLRKVLKSFYYNDETKRSSVRLI